MAFVLAANTTSTSASHPVLRNAEPSKWNQRKPKFPLICTGLPLYIHDSPSLCSISSISSLSLDSLLENDDMPSTPSTPSTPLSQISPGSEADGVQLYELCNISDESVDSNESKVLPQAEFRVHFAADTRRSGIHPRPRVPTPIPSVAKGNGVRLGHLTKFCTECIAEEELPMKLDSLDVLPCISAFDHQFLYARSPRKRLIVKRFVVKAVNKLGSVLSRTHS
ncbi:hypothetical protein BS47DRAFT_1340169 [Hydnum rufescens UP504]|uniref:Uncharacterized protein n=1 Tax=Hydnum rufescens UP504 TaxID=1448309 RepID=A0A9P6B4B0_9AGAM|nr:hypothetical protein BS47DRAFT_1340169 [Hydnum rufescens UP504]